MSNPSPAKIFCIYHGHCADGFGAAWAMHHNMPNADIEFFAASYDDKEVPNVRGRIVYMLDFSYKRNVIQYMIQESEIFLMLDHHKSAMVDLAGVDDQSNRREEHGKRPNTADFRISDGGRIMFDMNRSGALMAWDYFSNGKKAPKLIQHIDDRDRWQFKLKGTREIQAAVFSYPYNFDVWDTLMATDPARLYEEGVAIERKHFKDINELLPQATRPMILGGMEVLVANLPYTMSSDAGHILAKQSPSKIGACYTDTIKGRKFSIRSTEDGPDVSVIAQSYVYNGKGGGGHVHAGGFIMPLGWEGDRYTKVKELPRAEEAIADEALRNSGYSEKV